MKLYREQEEAATYYFDAMAWSGGECPGACLLARVFIRPIGAGDGATHTIHSVIAASCKKTSLSQHGALSVGSSTLMAALISRENENKCAKEFEVKYLLYSRACSHAAQSHSCTDSCSSQRC